MSLVAPIKDGKLQQTSTAKSFKEEATAKANSADKDQFLQMLVAEMKYQDPLEPSSNTEWISQYATFSELEQMQNMVESTEASRANDLVGKTVIVKTKGEDGDVSQVQGRVDYIVYEDGETMLSIDESLYSVKDLYMTVDETYLEAYDLGLEFSTRLGKLPKVDDITLADQTEIEELHKMYYDEMTDYQKSFITKDNKKLLDKYQEQLDNLLAVKKQEEEAAEANKVKEAAELAKKAAEEAKEAAEEARKAVEEAGKAGVDTKPEESSNTEATEEKEEISEETLDQLTQDV